MIVVVPGVAGAPAPPSAAAAVAAGPMPWWTPASPQFSAAVADVVWHLRNQAPAHTLRQAVSGDAIYAVAQPAIEDWRAVGRMPAPGDLMLGWHTAHGHVMAVFENGVVTKANELHIPVADKIRGTIVHEAEHHVGGCPPGHTDCSAAEIARTIQLGGHVNADQLPAVLRAEIARPSMAHG